MLFVGCGDNKKIEETSVDYSEYPFVNISWTRDAEHNKLIALVQKKLQRGDSVEKIADDLMESNETITGIIDIINK